MKQPFCAPAEALRRVLDAAAALPRPAVENVGLDEACGRIAAAPLCDQWTNMIQPFWALPALGIAKLSARDIMGYLVIVLLFTGVVACLGFLAWGLWF